MTDTAPTHLLPGLGPRDPESASRIKNEVAHSCCCDDEKRHGDKEDGIVVHPGTMLFAHFNNHGHFQATLNPAQDLHAFQVANHNGNDASCTCKRETEPTFTTAVFQSA